MGIKFVVLDRDSKDLPLFDVINREAFPADEFYPISTTLDVCNNIFTNFWGIYLDGVPAGLVCKYLKEQTGFIQYFAIKDEYRNKGLGSFVLNKLQLDYPEINFFCEVESEEVLSDNSEQRKRRLKFYKNNGFEETGYYLYYANTEFKLMVASKNNNQDNFRIDGFLEAVRKINEYCPSYNPRIYNKSKALDIIWSSNEKDN